MRDANPTPALNITTRAIHSISLLYPIAGATHPRGTFEQRPWINPEQLLWLRQPFQLRKV